MEVTDRIRGIVNEIEFSKIADIGTDHAFIPIYALAIGKITSAIACDLNAGPVSRAVENAIVFDSCGEFSKSNISIRRGDGLESLQPNEVETIVIAGMGGMLITEILKRGVDKLESVKQMILQPQHDIPEVRRFVHTIGFRIKNEKILIESGIYYNIINCVKSEQIKEVYTETEYLLGKILIERREPIFIEYLESEAQKLSKIKSFIVSKNMEHGETNKNSLERIKEIDDSLERIREVIK